MCSGLTGRIAQTLFNKWTNSLDGSVGGEGPARQNGSNIKWQTVRQFDYVWHIFDQQVFRIAEHNTNGAGQYSSSATNKWQHFTDKYGSNQQCLSLFINAVILFSYGTIILKQANQPWTGCHPCYISTTSFEKSTMSTLNNQFHEGQSTDYDTALYHQLMALLLQINTQLTNPVSVSSSSLVG